MFEKQSRCFTFILDAGDLSDSHTARISLPGQKAGWIQESIWTFIIIVVIITTTGLLDLDAGRLARSQNPEGPATGHLDPGFLGFPGS